MGGIGLVVRAELRRRWLALVLIGVLAGIVGGGVTAAVAGARRSETAYDRLAERTGQPDAVLSSFLGERLLDEVEALPEVATSWRLRFVVAQLLDVPEVTYLSIASGQARPEGLFVPQVEAGRLPDEDAAGEVMVDAGVAEDSGIAVGDRFRLGLLTQEEFESFDEGFGRPDGPTVQVEVTGTFTVAGNEAAGGQVTVLGTAAFTEVAAGGGGGGALMVELAEEPGAEERFEDGVLAAAASLDLPVDADLGAFELTLAGDDRDRVQSATGVVGRGLLLVGAAGMLIGIGGLAQTVLRHRGRSLAAAATLGALGLDRRGRALAELAPFVLVAAPVAAVVTVGLGVALSPLLPIGVARVLEPSPGIEVNVAVLAGAAILSAVVVLLVVVLLAVRGMRQAKLRPAERSLLGLAGRAGLTLPMALGAGLALDRGRGRASVPVRAAMAGLVVAVAATVGSASFATSLDRLVETPERYGAPGDLIVSDAQDDLIAELVADPDVEGLLEARGFDLVVEGSRQDARTSEVLKGSIGFTYVDGRAPSGPSEVALGPALAGRLDVGIGDEVRLDDLGTAAQVVGLVLAQGDTGERYADTVVIDEEAQAQTPESGGFREVIVRYADDVDVAVVAQELAARVELEVFSAPGRIRDVAQVRNLPLVLSGGAGLLGLVLLGHALVVTVRRRGHDLALLRALGSRPRETALAVVAMTLTLVGVGVLLGLPLGVFAGNLAWRAMAESLFVADDLAVPLLVCLLCPPVVVVVGLAVAGVPIRRAERLDVADQLRRE